MSELGPLCKTCNYEILYCDCHLPEHKKRKNSVRQIKDDPEFYLQEYTNRLKELDDKLGKGS